MAAPSQASNSGSRLELLLQQTSQWLAKPWIGHSLLWLLYIALMLIINSDWRYWQFTLANILIHALFLAGLVYLNLWYLLPRFFRQGHFISYALYMSFAVSVILPLEVWCLFYNMRAYPLAQLELLNNQWVHFAFLWLATFSTTILTVVRDWFRQQRIQLDLERRNLQSELSFLRSQINPHFLFNTLNSLYALSLQKSDLAPEMILRLSDIMRYMLYECNEKLVSLQREIDYIHNYLELERMRFGRKARLDFEWEADREDYFLAPLLFVPFLENSVKHGLSHQLDDEGFIEVELFIEQGELEFIVRNSKPSRKPQPQGPGGIGLKNIKRRLELLYPGQYSLEFSEHPELYIVHFQLSLPTEPKSKS